MKFFHSFLKFEFLTLLEKLLFHELATLGLNIVLLHGLPRRFHIRGLIIGVSYYFFGSPGPSDMDITSLEIFEMVSLDLALLLLQSYLVLDAPHVH